MRHTRHARKSDRKPGRAELIARNMKRRAPQQEQSATAPRQEPQVPADVPYDPVSVPVRRLADKLTEHSRDEVLALQAADPRTSTDRYYEARLEDLAGA